MIPTVVIKTGFSLYHTTPLITEKYLEVLSCMYPDPHNLKKEEMASKMPLNSFSEDLVVPKYFTPSRMHALEYGSPRREAVVLCYKTKRNLRLFDCRGLNRKYADEVRNTLDWEDGINADAEIDGWIMEDAMESGWYEFLLYRPHECVDHNYQKVTYTDEEIDQFEEGDESLYVQEENVIIESGILA
jgi:hypothetical protein